MSSLRLSLTIGISLLIIYPVFVDQFLANASEKEATTKDEKQTSQSWTDWAFQRAGSVIKRNGNPDDDGKGREAADSVSEPSSVKDKLWSYVSGLKSFSLRDAKGSVASASSEASPTEGTTKKLENVYEAAKAGVGGGTKQAKEHMERAAEKTSEAATSLGSKIKESVGIGGGRDDL